MSSQSSREESRPIRNLFFDKYRISSRAHAYVLVQRKTCVSRCSEELRESSRLLLDFLELSSYSEKLLSYSTHLLLLREATELAICLPDCITFVGSGNMPRSSWTLLRGAQPSQAEAKSLLTARYWQPSLPSRSASRLAKRDRSSPLISGKNSRVPAVGTLKLPPGSSRGCRWHRAHLP